MARVYGENLWQGKEDSTAWEGVGGWIPWLSDCGRANYRGREKQGPQSTFSGSFYQFFLLVKPWAYLSCQSGKESLFLREHQTHLSLHYSWKSSVRAVRSGEVWQATGNLFSAWGRVVSKWVFGNSRQLFIISNAYSIQNTILGSFKVIWPVLLSWLHFVIWNTTGEMSHTYTEIKISHVFSIQRSNQVTSPEKNKMI